MIWGFRSKVTGRVVLIRDIGRQAGLGGILLHWWTTIAGRMLKWKCLGSCWKSEMTAWEGVKTRHRCYNLFYDLPSISFLPSLSSSFTPHHSPKKLFETESTTSILLKYFNNCISIKLVSFVFPGILSFFFILFVVPVDLIYLLQAFYLMHLKSLFWIRVLQGILD